MSASGTPHLLMHQAGGVSGRRGLPNHALPAGRPQVELHKLIVAHQPAAMSLWATSDAE